MITAPSSPSGFSRTSRRKELGRGLRRRLPAADAIMVVALPVVLAASVTSGRVPLSFRLDGSRDRTGAMGAQATVAAPEPGVEQAA